MFNKKSLIKNHKTGKTAGKNEKVTLETNTSRKGLGELGNAFMDIVDAFTEDSRSREVVNAYVEREGSKHVVVVTFDNGKSDTRTFSFSSDANDFLHEIQGRARLIKLQGSSFTFTNARVMVNPDYVIGVKPQGDNLKINFRNDTSITIKYSFRSYMNEDLAKLGYGRSNSCGFGFGDLGLGRSRIKHVLDL